MSRLSHHAAVLALAPALALAGPVRAAENIPAQDFVLDPSHSTVVFRVSHLGLGAYTGGFDEIAARLHLDPANPETAELTAEIAVASLDLPAPPADFLALMLAPPWFDAAAHPAITYVSDRVTRTGPETARVEGTLSLNGQTQPVTLHVTFNAAYPAGLFEPHARIGFSAEAEISRSTFGMGFGVPEPGSEIGVGDAVQVQIEAEFTGTGSD